MAFFGVFWGNFWKKTFRAQNFLLGFSTWFETKKLFSFKIFLGTLIRFLDHLWPGYARAGRSGHYSRFWKTTLLKNGDFPEFFFEISKYIFFGWWNFFQNWFWNTLGWYIYHKKILYDLRTKGTNYEILKKKFPQNFDEKFHEILKNFFFKIS